MSIRVLLAIWFCVGASYAHGMCGRDYQPQPKPRSQHTPPGDRGIRLDIVTNPKEDEEEEHHHHDGEAHDHEHDHDHNEYKGASLGRPAHVEKSIRAAVEYLRQRARDDRGWGDVNEMSFIAYAMLCSGEDPTLPPQRNALQAVQRRLGEGRNATFGVSYAAASATLIPSPHARALADPAGEWLATNLPRTGHYGYNREQSLWAEGYASSTGAYGLLCAAEAGVKVNEDTWRRLRAAWRSTQNSTGGWNYFLTAAGASPNMTTGGIYTLYATNDIVDSDREKDLEDDKPYDGIAEAMDLMEHYPTVSNWSAAVTLVGHQRLGEISGLPRFGEHVWYAAGVRALLRAQRRDGSWGDPLTTAHALIFLSRGRAPIPMQKLAIKDARWNNRPRDLHHFNRWLKRYLVDHTDDWRLSNWQAVSPHRDIDELRESPVLYLASDAPLPPMDPQHLQRLNEFVQQGGVLLLVNEGTTDRFVQDVERTFERVFAPYRFRPLPADHPIYAAKLKGLPPMGETLAPLGLRGLSNGVRELVIVAPQLDLPVQWQTAPFPLEVKPETPAHVGFAMGVAIVNYATDSFRLRYKGQTTWIDRKGPTPEQKLVVGRVAYHGNWDPEPTGWARFGNLLHNQGLGDLQVRRLEIEKLPEVRDVKAMHITATEPLQLPPEQKAGLREYIDYNGLLIFDAAGGHTAAGDSFVNLMREFFPGLTLAPIPLTHPIYTGEGTGGDKITEVEFRPYARHRIVADQKLPRLKGLFRGERLIVVVSLEDLSGGLVGQDVDGITGYTPEWSARLMRNIILWARTQ